MPAPLIILENHIDDSAKMFVTKYVKALKEIGYKKLYLEMNSEISPHMLKQQLNNLLQKIPPHHSGYSTTKNLLSMLNALEENNIEYKFIDPQTQQDAYRLNMQLKTAQSHEEARAA